MLGTDVRPSSAEKFARAILIAEYTYIFTEDNYESCIA
jgi:hypothetical protein